MRRVRRGDFVQDGRGRLRTQPQIGQENEQERGNNAEREVAVQDGHDPAQRGCVMRKTCGRKTPDQRGGCEPSEGRKVAAEIRNLEWPLASGTGQVIGARDNFSGGNHGQAIRALSSSHHSPPMRG